MTDLSIGFHSNFIYSQSGKHLADSDHYYNPKEHVFWAYTEGRRSREVHLFSDNDYRITYSCDERQVDGRLNTRGIQKFLIEF